MSNRLLFREETIYLQCYQSLVGGSNDLPLLWQVLLYPTQT
ncbi:TPA_asm: hypothetical protein [Porphyromonas phage phage032a_KCOM2801]|uniref:Uncharacterized protein n=1 Tax=Porphyromonas phage phage032a_KCOM2801 TaxID=3154122 RepID=A0AAT9J9T9_9CAUD